MSQLDSSQPAPSPSGLRLRLGGSAGGFDPDAVARAEAALKKLSANFAVWLADEIAKLKAARAAIDTDGLTSATIETLPMRAHDLKEPWAAHTKYPIITRIARISLCKIVDDPAQRAEEAAGSDRRPHPPPSKRWSRPRKSHATPIRRVWPWSRRSEAGVAKVCGPPERADRLADPAIAGSLLAP